MPINRKGSLMSENWPKTVDEAVTKILKVLDEASKNKLRSMAKADLIMFHHNWGTNIRNDFGLWRGNTAILKDTGRDDPDDASMVIMEAVWEKLNKTEKKSVGPHLRVVPKLDSNIDPRLERKLTILLSFRLGPEFSESFEDFGLNAIWASDQDKLRELAKDSDIDIALEWQWGLKDFSVRDMLRHIGKNVPIIMCRNWKQGCWQDDSELKINGYAAAVDVPFKVEEFIELCKRLTAR
jgi:hypothetical protein